MAYNPDPLFSWPNLKRALVAALAIAAYFGVSALLGLIFADATPRDPVSLWLAILGYGAYLAGSNVWANREAWLTDLQSLEFERSHELYSARLGSIFFVILGGLLALLAYRVYPE